MSSFEDRAKALVATAAQIAKLQGNMHEANVLQQASARLIPTGYDNWNGGTDLFTLLLEIPIPAYATIEGQREKLEKEVHHRIIQLVRPDMGNSVTEVVISPILIDEAQIPEKATNANENEAIPSFWQEGYFRLFISHISSNKRDAHQLREELASYHIAAFVAHDDIEPTKEWEAEIEGALRTMDACTAMISPGFVESRWCDQEVGIAIGRSKLVVPLCMGANPHGFLGKFQGFQAKELPAATVAYKLFEILLKHELSSQRMTEALLVRMVNSMSWSSSKSTMTFLEKSPRLNIAQVGKLIRAIDENSQVGEAFGIPERIRLLVSRVGENKERL